ncbi:hypothetical protein MASR2M70_00650 [Bacillota bacterium]
MREKIHSYLGFAKRSGNLISGYNSCLYCIKRGQAQLILITEDLSDNTKKKFLSVAESAGVKLRVNGTIDTMQEMTGEIGRGIYAITDENLAKAILSEIDGSGQSGKEWE